MKQFQAISDGPQGQCSPKEEEKPTKRKRHDESGVQELLASALGSMTADQDRRSEHQTSMLHIELARNKREEAEAEQRHQMHLEDLKAKKWAAYHDSLKHEDTFSKLRTEKLMQELQELEGF